MDGISSIPMNRTKLFLLQAGFALVMVTVFLGRDYLLAAEPLSINGAVLYDKYPAVKTQLENNQFGIPLYLESQEANNSLHVDVYGIFDYPFDSVRDALQEPENWCDINILLFNVKTCTFGNGSNRWLLTLYSGRKFYQAPEDAYKLDFKMNIAVLQPEYLDITLSAKDGPLLTTDHRIRLEAIPLDEGRTFLHFSYDYIYGVLARAAIKSYYATIGFGKKGFSIIATDSSGGPVYVGGTRGSMERNAVSYYLAIQTFMDTLIIPPDQRFEKQISHWYDLTARFPLQLHELAKGEYLANKRREHHNQLSLQRDAVK